MDLLDQVFAVICFVGAGIYKWVQLSHPQRAEYKSLASKVAKSGAVILILIVSAHQIFQFGVSAEPLTRLAVLWVLINAFNLVSYALIGSAMYAAWFPEKDAAATSVESEPTA